MHLNLQLTRNIEIGATRRKEWDKEIVRTDGGGEVRNTRWSSPLRSFDVALPPCVRTNADYIAVQQMWEDSEGGTHSFDFYDYSADELVKVRFDSPLEITWLNSELDKIEAFTLAEVRE
jgi:hypothetical protein